MPGCAFPIKSESRYKLRLNTMPHTEMFSSVSYINEISINIVPSQSSKSAPKGNSICLIEMRKKIVRLINDFKVNDILRHMTVKCHQSFLTQ